MRNMPCGHTSISVSIAHTPRCHVWFSVAPVSCVLSFAVWRHNWQRKCSCH